ncbi:hypothetical protein [Kitasatospora sp. NBC_01300]|uniref:hypothetical protein n=1 Tax=Kitasatospora sp. NBC_01300 TaxID=2903574 RepID=UPI002F915DB4|nr:hypothetical protein OG556_40930 [Kitasatospora sp. NBC_01300]
MQHRDDNERAIPAIPRPRHDGENTRPGGAAKPPATPRRIPGQRGPDSRES